MRAGTRNWRLVLVVGRRERVGDAATVRDSVSAELTSPEPERRMEILEQRMCDSYELIENLQSVQKHLRTALNELREDTLS